VVLCQPNYEKCINYKFSVHVMLCWVEYNMCMKNAIKTKNTHRLLSMDSMENILS